MGVNSLPKTVTRHHRGCDLNPGPTAPESSMLTTWGGLGVATEPPERREHNNQQAVRFVEATVPVPDALTPPPFPQYFSQVYADGVPSVL